MIDIELLRKGDRKTLAKAITLLESSRKDHRAEAEKLLTDVSIYSGNSIRIGLTGVPGVGKSTLIEALGKYVISQGYRLAVLAVDPSSTLSGGSILGDKTRMQTLAVDPDAFIRPTPAGSSMGGVARRTRESIVLCEAAGFDVIVVETVGVGQSETLVSEMTDLFLLMLLPGGGDELQGIKRGIMELADIVVINKADGELLARAKLSAADVQQALRLIKPRHHHWQVPVMTASAQHNTGIKDLWDKVGEFREILRVDNQFDTDRKNQARNWLWVETRELLLSRFREDAQIKQALENLQQQVMDGEILPATAASWLVSEFLDKS
jgi:LAO/AO transport system kinase